MEVLLIESSDVVSAFALSCLFLPIAPNPVQVSSLYIYLFTQKDIPAPKISISTQHCLTNFVMQCILPIALKEIRGL